MVEVHNLFQYVGHIQVSHILLCGQAVIAYHYHVCTGPSFWLSDKAQTNLNCMADSY